jgi:hypothetical protein
MLPIVHRVETIQVHDTLRQTSGKSVVTYLDITIGCYEYIGAFQVSMDYIGLMEET